MPGASPLCDDLDTVRRLEDAGAAALVMHSLFEEQIEQEQRATRHALEAHLDSHAEALSYFPASHAFPLGPEAYLEQIRRIKQAVAIPVIASLNGTTASGWLEYARLIEQAGADALELNVYHLPTAADESSAEVEGRVVDVVRTVKAAVRLPVAAKLSPFYSALPHLAVRLSGAGASGLVLFNRFYQPDIDPEQLLARPTLRLSDPSELLLRLRLAGAHAVQLVSALLLHGPDHLRTLLVALTRWLEEHEYASLAQMRGSMSLRCCPDPAAFERGNYLRILQSFDG
jgi:dihydroorotate dehydrogenase (fumarate)